MVIKDIEVSNYRSLKNCKFNFEDKHNIYVGKNGSGKTHALEAFNSFFNLDESIKEMVDPYKKLKYSANFSVSNGEVERIALATLKSNEPNNLTLRVGANKVEYTLNNRKISRENYESIHNLITSSYIVIYNSTFSYTEITDLSHIKEKANKKIKNVDKKIEGLVEAPYEVQVNYTPTIEIVKRTEKYEADIFNCNTGAIRDAHLQLLKRSGNSKNIIFLYDEIETHYHPQKVVKEYYELINTFGMTLISTHSSELVNTVLLDQNINISLIRDNISNSLKERELLKGILNTTKINSKLLFSDFIIFVEGRFDTHFIEKLLIKFNINQYKVDIFELSGGQDHKKVREFMYENGFSNYVIILDRDIRYEILEEKKVSNNKKLKNEISKYILNTSELGEEKIRNDVERLFNDYAYKSKMKIVGEDGIPIYSKKPQFKIGQKYKGKYIILDSDLELELCTNRKGRFAIKQVMNLNSIDDVDPRDHKVYKNKIIEIIDRYFSVNLEKADLPQPYIKLLKILEFNLEK